jgi:hypothetical protein
VYTLVPLCVTQIDAGTSHLDVPKKFVNYVISADFVSQGSDVPLVNVMFQCFKKLSKIMYVYVLHINPGCQ